MREDWIECTLNDIAIWGSGGTPKSTNSEFYNGGIPWLIIGDLNDGYVNTSEKSITKLGLDNSSAKLVKPNSVLIAMYGSIGKLGINSIEVATNQAIAFTKFLPAQILNKYLFHYLFYCRPKLYAVGKGGTQKNISQTVLKQFAFPLIPLPEQRAIVAKIEELFSDLDKGIVDLKKAQDQLKVYRQAVLKKAFEGGYTIGSTDSENYTINGIKSSIPKSWSVCALGDLVKLQGGFAFKSAEYQQSGIPIVKIKNVHYQDIDWSEKTFIDETRKEEFKNYSLNEGDVLIAMTRPVIKSLNNVKTVIVKKSDLPALLNQRVGRFVINGELNKDFLKYFIFTDFFKRRVLKESSSSQQPNISSTKIEKFDFIVPDTLEEQHKIVQEIESRLSVCEKVELSITESLEKAKALRQSILKKAFEGTLLSEEEIAACKAALDYEPASVLLEKIKAEKKK